MTYLNCPQCSLKLYSTYLSKMQISVLQKIQCTCIYSSVADPDPFDPDPDPAFNFDTDPDHAFQFDVDSDPTV